MKMFDKITEIVNTVKWEIEKAIRMGELSGLAARKAERDIEKSEEKVAEEKFRENPIEAVTPAEFR